MRWMLAALIAAAAIAPGAAFAQASGFAPAPVPNRGVTLGAPSARAGSPDGAERGAPFSGLPSAVESRGDAPATTLDTSFSTGNAVPSLSR